MTAMLIDSGDFAQVPFSQEALAPVQDEDWLGQLQVLDLPQLFSFKDSTSDFSSEELDDFSKGVDISTLETLLDVVPPTAQHDAPGPTRATITKPKEEHSPITQPTSTPTKRIAISRDELLKFTSEDLEAYVKALSATRTLTTTELKEIKRQRR
jgi:hypothetical protein